MVGIEGSSTSGWAWWRPPRAARRHQDRPGEWRSRRRGRLARLLEPTDRRTAGSSRGGDSGVAAGTVVELHERLVDQARQDSSTSYARVGRGDRLGRVEGEPPAKTESRRSTTVPSSSSSWLQSTDAAQRLLAGQRGAAAAGEQAEPVVELGRDLLGGRDRTRAAASSMASGMPSSRWQICATAGGVLVGRPRSSGRAWTARSTNRRTASYCASVARGRAAPVGRQASDGTRQVTSPGRPERLAAGGQHREPGSGAGQRVGERRRPRRARARSCRARASARAAEAPATHRRAASDAGSR